MNLVKELYSIHDGRREVPWYGTTDGSWRGAAHGTVYRIQYTVKSHAYSIQAGAQFQATCKNRTKIISLIKTRLNQTARSCRRYILQGRCGTTGTVRNLV